MVYQDTAAGLCMARAMIRAHFDGRGVEVTRRPAVVQRSAELFKWAAKADPRDDRTWLQASAPCCGVCAGGCGTIALVQAGAGLCPAAARDRMALHRTGTILHTSAG